MEVLDSLAYSNFYSPRPQPIDPAIFFDLVKIRRLVDDATSLAVRAANGTTSAALSASSKGNTGTGLLGGSEAELLGISAAKGGGGGGVAGTAKLSRERKYRMREHASQKLSQAYHLDEIASSVAMMQAASALEEVAKLVLQRNPSDPDASYVHFFHEKIPSRRMAECTSLAPLDAVIRQRPTDGSLLRTRAVTRIFKDDFVGAAHDLTEALAVHRLYGSQQHANNQPPGEVVLARDAAKRAAARDYRADARVDEKDHPSSLHGQLLFHRAGAYLTLACNHIGVALRDEARPPAANGRASPDDNGEAHRHCAEGVAAAAAAAERQKASTEARKSVRTYAKRALRDYTAFLSHFDYTPGLPAEFTQAFLHKVKSLSKQHSSVRSRSEKLLDLDAHSKALDQASPSSSSALVRYESQKDDRKENNPLDSLPSIPRPPVYPLNELFASVPPANLPPYPPDPSTATGPASSPHDHSTHPVFSLPDFTEAVTYHPLLTDALHSLLLAHSLIQTPPKEHLRHAYMAARLARVCDGYPIFLGARSPARADWIEVLRRTKNWLGVQGKWEDLCAPAPLPGPQLAASGGGLQQQQDSGPRRGETDQEKRERRTQEAIVQALADERVFDEQTFRASVRARELQAAREEEEEQRKEYLRTTCADPKATPDSTTTTQQTAGTDGVSGSTSGLNGAEPGAGASAVERRWAQEDGKEYPITTERAEAIARWIREAPSPHAGEGAGKTKKSKKGLKARPSQIGRVTEEIDGANSDPGRDVGDVGGLRTSVESLDLGD